MYTAKYIRICNGHYGKIPAICKPSVVVKRYKFNQWKQNTIESTDCFEKDVGRCSRMTSEATRCEVFEKLLLRTSSCGTASSRLCTGLVGTRQSCSRCEECEEAFSKVKQQLASSEELMCHSPDSARVADAADRDGAPHITAAHHHSPRAAFTPLCSH
ncbi:hypothetical protein PYW08_011482 [Mythimna loreyi]|uniref:Uncharacterized protein n=1 Tax=Mythimna loreyi TaxID=667449 RepID=A0ACC2QKM8_9NEOP|nr:hypothetical protein PYW08_011482 [Mythimna loreyi]